MMTIILSCIFEIESKEEHPLSYAMIEYS